MSDEYFEWRAHHHSMALPKKDTSRAYEAFQLLFFVDES